MQPKKQCKLCTRVMLESKGFLYCGRCDMGVAIMPPMPEEEQEQEEK